jgi:transposase
MVVAPTPEEEDRRRLCRERGTLIAERIRHVNRIKGLLFAQGVGDYAPLRRNRRARLEALRTGDGRALPSHLKAQISRELDRLELLLEQIKQVETEQDALLEAATNATGANAMPEPVAMLLALKGIGVNFAGTSPIAASLPPMRALRRRHGGAAASSTSKASRRPAIRGCGPR